MSRTVREAFHRVPFRDVGECITGHHESDDHRSKGARHTNRSFNGSSHWPGRAKKRFDVVVLGLVAFVVVESFEGRAISFVKDEQRRCESI